jgi:hypothetical protein
MLLYGTGVEVGLEKNSADGWQWVPLRYETRGEDSTFVARGAAHRTGYPDALWRRVLLRCSSRSSRRFVYRGPPLGSLALLLAPRDSDFGPGAATQTTPRVRSVQFRIELIQQNLERPSFCRSHFANTPETAE